MSGDADKGMRGDVRGDGECVSASGGRMEPNKGGWLEGDVAGQGGPTLTVV